MVSLVLGLGELIVLRQRISVIPRNFRSWGKPLFGLTSTANQNLDRVRMKDPVPQHPTSWSSFQSLLRSTLNWVLYTVQGPFDLFPLNQKETGSQSSPHSSPLRSVCSTPNPRGSRGSKSFRASRSTQQTANPVPISE